MKAIVRKEKKRKMEDPPKNSIFRVRNYPVNSKKIARFKRDKGIDDDGDVVIPGTSIPPSTFSFQL